MTMTMSATQPDATRRGAYHPNQRDNDEVGESYPTQCNDNNGEGESYPTQHDNNDVKVSATQPNATRVLIVPQSKLI